MLAYLAFHEFNISSIDLDNKFVNIYYSTLYIMTFNVHIILVYICRIQI